MSEYVTIDEAKGTDQQVAAYPASATLARLNA